jgi:hypothetical protein
MPRRSVPPTARRRWETATRSPVLGSVQLRPHVSSRVSPLRCPPSRLWAGSRSEYSDAEPMIHRKGAGQRTGNYRPQRGPAGEEHGRWHHDGSALPQLRRGYVGSRTAEKDVIEHVAALHRGDDGVRGWPSLGDRYGDMGPDTPASEHPLAWDYGIARGSSGKWSASRAW